MCSFDWGIAAAWAQFFAIAFTGVGAIWVANRQLQAYNDALKASNENERLRNSIKVLDDMRAVTSLQDQECSPLDATLYAIKTANDPDERRRYQTFVNRRASGDSAAATDATFYDETKTKIGIAAFYYMDLYDLLDRGRLDELYVMAKVSAFLLPFYSAIGKLGDQFHDNLRLKAVVERTQALPWDTKQRIMTEEATP